MHTCTCCCLAACFLFHAGTGVLAESPKLGKFRQKLYVVNTGGDDLTVVDVATHKVLGSIQVGPHPHGIAAPAAQDVLYVTVEGSDPGQLVSIDPAADKVIQRVDVGSRPNQPAVTPDGAYIFIPVDDGSWEVFDNTLAVPKVVAKIETGGRPHNTLCSADGKHMYLAPMAKSPKDNPSAISIVSVATRKVIGKLSFSDAIRPIALSADEKRLYANVDNLLGMEVADVASRKVIHRIAFQLPNARAPQKSRAHGIAIRPDQKEVWTCDVENQLIFVFDVSSDPPKQIASVPMGGQVYWLTFTPDGKLCYVSVGGKNEVVAVDAMSKKVVSRIKVGQTPKRLLVVAVPEKKQ